LFLSGAATVLVFFNLYAIHSYYLIAVYPSLAALGALGVVRLWELRPADRPIHALGPAVLVLFWLLSTHMSPLGRHDVDDLLHETRMPQEVEALSSATPSNAKIVTIGCGWNSQYFYLAHRTGLMLTQINGPGVAELIEDIWREDDIKDYTYILRCDPADPIGPYLPAGTTWVATNRPEVFALRRTAR
jgi:hypothetical protein